MERPKLAEDFMVTKLVTVRPEMNVFDGLRLLLRQNITGAPVIDEEGNYLGVFSETCCLRLLVSLADDEGEAAQKSTQAQEFMTKTLLTLSPDMDVFEAIGLLLQRRVSGAPVIDESGTYLGVFSEKYSMRVVLGAAYDQLPSPQLSGFMNTEPERIINEETDLLAVARLFLDSIYRRLPVVRDGKLVGQISRRDVLRASPHLTSGLRSRDETALDQRGQSDLGADPRTRVHERLPSTDISSFMDVGARTIAEDTDILRMAHIFLTTPHRRLPVLRDGKLVGQISRRDLLSVLHDQMALVRQPQRALLYLSAVTDGEPLLP